MDGSGPAEAGQGRRPGLANERTALSWQRSILSLLVTAALVVRTGILSGSLAVALPLAAALVATAIAVASVEKIAYQRGMQSGGRRPGPRPRLVRAMAFITVVCGAASFALVLS